MIKITNSRIPRTSGIILHYQPKLHALLFTGIPLKLPYIIPYICIKFDPPRLGNLVGGCNPFEKYLSNWKSSPNRGEHKKYLKPQPSNLMTPVHLQLFRKAKGPDSALSALPRHPPHGILPRPGLFLIELEGRLNHGWSTYPPPNAPSPEIRPY